MFYVLVRLTRLPLTWRDIATRTVREFVADNGIGRASQLADYFFFSLFRGVLVGIAVASFLPLEHFVDRMVATLGGVVPGDIIAILQDQVRKISEGNNGGILTFGLAAALWSSSAALSRRGHRVPQQGRRGYGEAGAPS
jgi:membrane protein